MSSNFALVWSKRKLNDSDLDTKKKQTKHLESATDALSVTNLDEECLLFKCGCRRGNEKAYGMGGCFRECFRGANGGYDHLKMYDVLTLYRAKTYYCTRTEINEWGLKLFKEHVINLNEVIQSASQERESLFGGDISSNFCGSCNTKCCGTCFNQTRILPENISTLSNLTDSVALSSSASGLNCKKKSSSSTGILKLKKDYCRMKKLF
jgi:hypothetical protein